MGVMFERREKGIKRSDVSQETSLRINKTRLYNTAELRNAEIPQKPLDIKQQLTGRQLSFSRSP